MIVERYKKGRKKERGRIRIFFSAFICRSRQTTDQLMSTSLTYDIVSHFFIANFCFRYLNGHLQNNSDNIFYR